MNPETNRFEELTKADKKFQKKMTDLFSGLLRPDGSQVPKHWSVFQIGELVSVKDYTFKVAYINETTLLLEPVGVPEIGTESRNDGP